MLPIISPPTKRLDLRKIKRPTKEELIDLIIKNPISHISKQFNISNNSIKKWCLSYKIDHKRKNIIEKYLNNKYLALDLNQDSAQI